MVSIDNEAVANYESVEAVLGRYLEELGGKTFEPEEIKVEDSLDRILYDDIISQVDLPSYNKAMADGYAVNSHKVALADLHTPVILELVGEANVGDSEQMIITRDQAVKISAGAMLPQNANAIVLPENAQLAGDKISILKSVLIGENVTTKGEDLSVGEFVIKKQRKIRPQDIGGMLNLGYRKIRVFKKPDVAIIPTGSELVSIDSETKVGQVYETSSFVLKGVIEQLGGICQTMPIVGDNPDMIRDSIVEAAKKSDIILILGGSSQGTKDFTLKAISNIENSRVIVQDIAMKPGKRTILSFVGEKPVIGLPGHPVSTVTSFQVFVKPVIIQLAGKPRSFWQERKDNVYIDAVLTKDVESAQGREDYVRVRLCQLENGKITAYPYATKASRISTLIKAHGMIKVPSESVKLFEGDRVKVLLF